MIHENSPTQLSQLRKTIARAYRADETDILDTLLEEAKLPADAAQRVGERASRLVQAVRRRPSDGGVEAFMQEYELSSHEGIVLMCLAEALLRVPDAETVDKLIEDKITSADWARHLGHSESLFVNASTWGFMLTGSLLSARESGENDLRGILTGLLARTGEPIIRQAITQAMKILGRQFIMGETIEDGLRRARALEKRGYRYSYDMLGEAARTNADAERYFRAYERAIAVIARAGGDPVAGPGLSVKLSALDPRYEFAQPGRVGDTVLPRLLALARQAKAAGIGLTVDAEEADRLDVSLDVIEAVAGDPSIAGWDGFGLALQAYQKRAHHVVDWLADLAERTGRRLMVRLVKGAYWDAEIKRAQEGGLKGYPVFTRKASTDLSYIACARKLLANPTAFYPQFATHNAQTVAVILELAGNRSDYEFQRLHGMGEPLYDEVTGSGGNGVACRIYAPCGGHKDLLPYLVRRLLENGANTSFVNRIMDEEVPIERITANPVEEVAALKVRPHPRIPLPRDIYGSVRRNAMGIDLSDPLCLAELGPALEEAAATPWRAAPVVGGETCDGPESPVKDPADHRRVVGAVVEADAETVSRAIGIAADAAAAWRARPAAERVRCLERTADLMEANFASLMAVAVREAGKTLPDAVAEVREAIDFCRYYAVQARRVQDRPVQIRGVDRSAFRRVGRGVFACISPWNFPLAIFTGQVTAALAAGNAVIAKPAEQTSIMASRAVALMHEAGVPAEVLHLLPGRGETVGASLVGDPRISGVAFTGGTETASAIRRALANRTVAPVPLIAETGGQNAMIVDSTALPEQAVSDIIRSAFGSAGQRCSALRVLFVQEDVADGLIDMLSGAMSELVVGDPALLRTDIGPVIDTETLETLTAHDRRMETEGRLIARCRLHPDETGHGTFFAPVAYEIDSLDTLKREVFGPALHVVRFEASRIDRVVAAINATGYGLTFGLHSRIDSVAEELRERIRAGNLYVNRNMIGAIVGVQPFGGEGLSGTGPKAGGPNYLRHFTRLEPEAQADREGATAADSPPDPSGNWTASPIVDGRSRSGAMVVTHPLDRPDVIHGSLVLATGEVVEEAMALAATGQSRWEALSAERRIACLDRMARELAEAPTDLVEICAVDLGMSTARATHEMEEAAAAIRDFASRGREILTAPLTLRGYTGERNELAYHARGTFLCLASEPRSLVALAGLVAAPLVTGNAVVLASFEGGAQILSRLTRRWLEAGVPHEVLSFLPVGDRDTFLDLSGDGRVAGVVVAGQFDAVAIERRLAERAGLLVPLICATEGSEGEPVLSDPEQLYRFATERVTSVDTTASGGNASLFSLESDAAS